MLAGISAFLLLVTGLFLHPPSVEGGYLELYVKDATGKAIKNIQITCKGEVLCSTGQSDANGKVRLKFFTNIQPTQWVSLQIVKHRAGVSWVFISPWDERVNVPSYENKAENTLFVYIVRRGDKQILRSGIALQAVLEWYRDRLTPLDQRDISDEARRSILRQQARVLGLAPEDLDKAIRRWGRNVKDDYRKGLALLYDQKFSRATPLLTRAYKESKEEFETTKKIHFDRVFSLGQSLYGEGEYGQAAGKFEEALALKNDDDVVVLSWLGNSLHEAGRFGDAEPLLKRVLDIIEKTEGKDHSDTAGALGDLAIVYESQGRFSEAESLYKRALDIREKALDKNNPLIAESLNNLAGLYHTQGRFKEADPLFRRALDIKEKALGKDHRSTATSVNNLAELYESEGRLNEAEPLYKRALDIRERVLGKDHPLTAQSLNNLAAFYYARGRYGEAESLYKRAISIQEKVLGKDHPSTANTISNLAVLYSKQGRYSDAEPLYKRSLKISEDTQGKDHPSTAISLSNLAMLYYKQKRYDEAEPLFKRALDIDEKVNKDHPDVATDLYHLAELYKSQGRYSEAAPLYERAIDIVERVLGKEHLTVAAYIQGYAALLRKISREEEALRLESRATAIKEKAKLKGEN